MTTEMKVHVVTLQVCFKVCFQVCFQVCLLVIEGLYLSLHLSLKPSLQRSCIINSQRKKNYFDKLMRDASEDFTQTKTDGASFPFYRCDSSRPLRGTSPARMFYARSHPGKLESPSHPHPP